MSEVFQCMRGARVECFEGLGCKRRDTKPTAGEVNIGYNRR